MYIQNGDAKRRAVSWNNNANLLYLDQPIGVGYSHGSIFNLPHNEQRVREYFGIFMFKFYERYPEFRNR